MKELIQASTRNKRRRLLPMLLVGLVCLLAVEGLARITSGPRWLNAHYVGISSGFAELDALIEDAQNMPGPRYYEEFLYGPGPFSSAHINFTDYYSARLTPDSVPLSQAEHVIWTFGGSTMENTETTDGLTIANTWARTFNDSLGPTHVKNFGTGGHFSSFELIKFQKLLRVVPQSELPTIAIFYDGYNDALNGFQYGPGSLQTDLSLKLQALVEQDIFTTGAYATSRALAHYSKFWERTAARLVEHLLFPLPEPDADASNLADAVHIYTSNARMIQATCQVFEIDCFFVLQPLIVTKKPLSQMEQDVLNQMEAHPRMGPEGIRFVREFYTRVIRSFAGNEHFIDASHILDGRRQADFYDLGHLGALSPPVVGDKIAHLILARLEETAPVSSDTVHTVTDSKWFSCPGNWSESVCAHALTDNPAHTGNLRFNGTGLRFGIDPTPFKALGPKASDCPCPKWRVEGGPRTEQTGKSSTMYIVLARGLEFADHALEAHLEHPAKP